MLKIKNKRHKIILILLVFGSLLGFILFLRYIKVPAQPDVILITVDALRADHLGCYGYARNTSPNIDKLAKEGTVFFNCFASVPATVRSFVGLLTGKYLTANKYGPFWDNVLDRKFTTLAEYLKSFGYYTMAFLANPMLRNGKGFERGFDHFYVFNGKVAKELTAQAITQLSKLPKDKPFFIWIHYLEPHAPYRFREDRFKNFEGDGLYKKDDKILGVRPNSLKLEVYFEEYNSSGYIPPVAFHKDHFNLNYYIACYDTEILTVDSYIGKLLRNIKDNAIIILTADHGESLGEHNVYFDHGEDMYDETLHTPLIIKDSRDFKRGEVVPTVVSTIDIVPTILNRINPIWYRFTRNKFDGIDLRLIARNKGRHRKYTYSYYYGGWEVRDINNGMKYMLHKNGQEELYILPDEYNNLISDNSPKIASIKEELRNNLRAWLKTYPVHSDTHAKKISLDKDTQEHLRSLGYLQ